MAVEIAAPSDPLLAGLAPFEVDDEQYVIEQHAEIEVLLQSRWGGEASGRHFEDDTRPLMYRRRLGDGEVLYLALGHCNRPFDKGRPDAPDGPDRRGPWNDEPYQTLIRRGIAWAAHRPPT